MGLPLARPDADPRQPRLPPAAQARDGGRRALRRERVGRRLPPRATRAGRRAGERGVSGAPWPGDRTPRPKTPQPLTPFGGRATQQSPPLLDVVAAKRGAPSRASATRRQRSMSDPVLLACRVTLADGTTAAGAYPPVAHTRAFLRAIVTHQEHVAAWLEVPRGPRIDGELRVARWPRENFHDPADHPAILAHVERHARRGQELFCGIVPKTEPEPRKGAAAAGRVVWVDIDRKSNAAAPTLEEIERLLEGAVATDALVAAARLLSLPARPHLVAFSGSGGAHGYWRIEQTLAAEWIERANVRLIHPLGDGADYASYDRNRFMRLPGTRNNKSGRYCQVLYADLTSRAYDVRDLVGELPAPPADDPRAPRRTRRQHTAPSQRRAAVDDPVDRWTPREYFAALCGVAEIDHDGKARCPLPDHDDPRASLWIGDTPEAGWFCFGGNRGRRIFDLASLLIGGPWGADLRGDSFRAARAELERRLRIPTPGR